jgi:hypothetical protein
MNKHFFGQIRLAAIVVLSLLLIATILVVLGQEAFACAFLATIVFYSLTILVFRTILGVNRSSGSDDNHLPFTFNPLYRGLYSIVDPRLSRSAQEEIERSQGELKPFVFKEMVRTDGGDENV